MHRTWNVGMLRRVHVVSPKNGSRQPKLDKLFSYLSVNVKAKYDGVGASMGTLMFIMSHVRTECSVHFRTFLPGQIERNNVYLLLRTTPRTAVSYEEECR